MELIIIVSVIFGVLLAVFLQIWLFVYYTKEKYKQSEKIMIQNTKILLNKLDDMDEEIRRLKENG